MPQKRKSPSPRKIKRADKQHRFFVIITALCIFFAIYWLSRPVKSQPKAEKIKTAESPLLNRQESTKQQKSKAERAIVASEKSEPQTQTEIAIQSAISKLHVNSRSIKRKKNKEAIVYSVPINPSACDLTFANMIFKGEVERCNGIFRSGEVKNKRQVLTFTDPDTHQNYQVELFYRSNEALPPSQERILCIIVDDFGNTQGKLLDGFAQTEAAVCFAILPDAKYAVEAMRKATQKGHETLIHVPMEPINYPKENPGDNAIFIHNSPTENARRMEHFINKLPACIGVNNHMGSLATSDEPTMQTVMQVLRKHNLVFVDSRTSNSSIAYTVAQKNLVPAFKRDVFLDEPDLSSATLNKKLSECLSLAQKQPFVIAIMHCHTQEHLVYLQKFIAQAKQKGFRLEPISGLSAYELPDIL
ncbi:MAG TPA: divergent polysaccharide deacetylase family protein [Candidatus Cloacimonadota bacterium]|nr:divergent polysaccharide deacetylase family protein [Candidatus Cloacimonadota bacterium]